MTAPSRTDQPHKIQPPRGTRDLYPAEAARRRWLTERWREVSVRHGFEEVDGPTFEASDLYAVKSGDGILGELFQAFSGKSPDEVEQVKDTGRAPYALRPEFTPTLARMYAAKAAGLPKPCKWFMAGPFFRAERPQRGRLREFLQWNCDVLGLDIPTEKWNAEDAESRAEVAEAKARMDAECIACCVADLESLGLAPSDVSIHFGSRDVVTNMLNEMEIPESRHTQILNLLDRQSKLAPKDFAAECDRLGFHMHRFQVLQGICIDAMKQGFPWIGLNSDEHAVTFDFKSMALLATEIEKLGITAWCKPDLSIARGLAYYTGTVFEVIADGERAVAGGGRYDNLIELFGGPKTPAVGFAMGDVVLSLLLQDKGLMPSGDELMGLVGQHPDVFVLSNGDEAAEARVRPTVAALRRGGESLAGLHVRHSYKATKNVGKLLKEAAQQGARFAVIIEDAESCSVKDTRTNEQWPDKVPLTDLHARLAGAM
ncbi:MAG: histidine--tRNA ligase family protein [Planctomycetota bacterium]|nr:MAG: histidine--tRNA ligase family protein [Planctomycetota bacterium]